MSLYARYSAFLDEVLDALEADGGLPSGLDRGPVAVEPPRDASHGDLATNAAMVLAKGAGTNPRALAALTAPKLAALPGVTEASVAGPGFINLRPSRQFAACGARCAGGLARFRSWRAAPPSSTRSPRGR